MADELYALTKKDVDILKQIVSAWRNANGSEPKYRPGSRYLDRVDILFGVAESAVAGTTGTLTNPGSGTLNVYKFTSTGGTTDTTRDETVYNLSSVARTTSEYTVAVRDYQSGKFMAVAGSGGTGSKKVCSFTLDASLTTTTEYAAAKITAQIGDGTAHSTTGTINVYNTLDGYTTGYIFDGSSGVNGLAYYDTGTNWKILQLFRYCS
jgi:hypothetical protein